MMHQFFEFLRLCFDVMLHLDQYLDQALVQYGHWLYGILFAVIFCETGLVVTPFLPGDSLLFATGMLTAREGSPLQIHWIVLSLSVAGILGDAVNYAIGRYIGPKVFTKEKSFLLNKKHLLRAQEFYEHHGGKAIIIARFVPIIRTFAPFVAGIGKMSYPRFAAFNIVGAISWVVIFTVSGHFIGDIPQVKKSVHYIVLAIIFISLIPIVIEYLRARRRSTQQSA
jgi:membrane-associated protein